MPTICRAALAGGMSQREPASVNPYLVGLIDAGTLEVRPAARADAAAVTALLHELGYPSNTGEEVTRRLAEWSGRDDLLVLVAAAGRQVVGVAALAVVPYFERPGCWGRVVALV